ncbi:MAG TPA: protease pro-enzyme activation domain-containing protein [Candidatus Sulfotelmatobacter sp.]|nr:protease pro-enzyme activation domain-containing protein [Candidatus Sulfotelmatobacter sp.]
MSILAGLLAALFCPGTIPAAQNSSSTAYVPAVVAQKAVRPINRLPATNELHLALSLPPRDEAGLTEFMREVYDPASPQFHHFLKKGEFAARFGPSPADYAKVIHFAETNGFKISATHASRLVVDVTGKVSEVEHALHVRLSSFRHPKENRNFFAAEAEPSWDAALPISHVSGLDNYSLPHPNVKLHQIGSATPRDGSGPGGTFMGNDFRQAYVPGSPLDGTGQNVALVQFDGFYGDDITNYENTIGLTNPPAVTVMPVDGGVTNEGDNDVEVTLDIEMVLAMSPGVSNILVYETTNGAAWEDILSQIADDDSAQQIGCSWGGGGPNPAAEVIFQQMAAQGQSYFNATGDSDAFVGPIEFPSESPNITQVGGTALMTDSNGDYVSETVWNQGSGSGSSGGSSLSVPIPPWQLGMDMTANGGSTVYRNVPDVALTASNVFLIYNHGAEAEAVGTSCAAPLWAGFTALVNQQAALQSQPPVGFLNPAIYGICRGSNYVATFHDTVTGDNTSYSSPDLYYAQTGYDLCTGWGTPDGTNLINALVTVDNLAVSPATNFLTVGPVGGPFSQTCWPVVLTNNGAVDLAWSLGVLPPWLSASVSGGTLAAGTATNILLQLDGAENLPCGNYQAPVMITNELSARVQSIGVLLAIGQNIVMNGGFEAGDFTGWTFAGDTVIGNSIYDAVVTEAEASGTVHSGNFGAFLGESGFLATLTQTLPTATNQIYQLSFWLNNPSAGDRQEFVANWNGTNLIDLVDPPASAGWTNFQFLVTANVTDTVLQFGAENDPNYFGFDDVSVIPVPAVKFADAMLSGGGLQFNWQSLAGLNYEIDYSTNLAPANWQMLGDVTAVTNTCGFADTNIFNGDCSRFYRLILLP